MKITPKGDYRKTEIDRMPCCMCEYCLESDDECPLKRSKKMLKILLSWLDKPEQRNINTLELRVKIAELQEEIIR